ncbi:hypothetical protein [Pseudomonas sp. CGJS7]|uniref:hypothetical protein n=1 Tax=Pseudomonas sp. CGJS7 TaxID=3109348 RepID=UPI00300B2CB4
MDSQRRSMLALLSACLMLMGWSQHAFAQTDAKAALADPAMAVEKAELPPKWMPPEPGSVRARVFAALADAQETTLYSLQPWQPPVPPEQWDELPYKERSRREERLFERSEREWCKREKCFHDNRVLGRTRVAAADLPVVRTALSDALSRVPDAVSLCRPEYRHAVSFVSAGQRFEVLLCYQCGQFLLVDGRNQEDGQAGSMGDQAAIDAILRRAGIALAKAPDDGEDEAE